VDSEREKKQGTWVTSPFKSRKRKKKDDRSRSKTFTSLALENRGEGFQKQQGIEKENPIDRWRGRKNGRGERGKERPSKLNAAQTDKISDPTAAVRK